MNFYPTLKLPAKTIITLACILLVILGAELFFSVRQLSQTVDEPVA
jgi:hypothetical protein